MIFYKVENIVQKQRKLISISDYSAYNKNTYKTQIINYILYNLRTENYKFSVTCLSNRK